MRQSSSGLWMLLLEKALAKSYGSYLASQRILLEHTFEEVFGAPTIGVWMQNFSLADVFGILKDVGREGYFAVATTKKQITNFASLSPVRHYPVVAVKGDSTADCRVLLYDLWHRNVPNFWHEKRPSDAFRLCEITLQNFCTDFQYLTVCLYRDKFEHRSVEVATSEHRAAYVLLQVKEPTQVSVVAHQPAKQRVRAAGAEYTYSKCEFKLFSIKPDKDSEFCVAHSGHTFLTHFGGRAIPISNEPYISLKPGKYVLRLKVYWPENKSYSVVSVSTYSDRRVHLKKLDKAQGKLVMLEYYRHLIDKSAAMAL